MSKNRSESPQPLFLLAVAVLGAFGVNLLAVRWLGAIAGPLLGVIAVIGWIAFWVSFAIKAGISPVKVVDTESSEAKPAP